MRPPGRLIRAASQMNAGDAPNATSRRVVHRKCQVRVPCRTAERLGPAARIITVLSLCARLRRAARARSAVSTSFGFCELARAGDDHVRRHGHRIIEVAIFEIEFLREVGQRVPAAKVVIDGHARIPLGDRVDRRRSALPSSRCGRPTAPSGTV